MNPLKIALVGHGLLPIPPTGWGAVESIIWEYAVRMRARGHHVDIINEKKRRAFRTLLLGPKYDFVHNHNERGMSRMRIASMLRGSKLIATSHHAYAFQNLSEESKDLLRKTCYAPYQLCLTQGLAKLIRKRKPGVTLEVLPNGCEVSQFRFEPSPGNGRAICVGRIESRKQQNLIADAAKKAGVPCDFVGPIKDDLLPKGANHLGEWSREELRSRLTEYSALVLFSKSEGQPLVVVEALAAGLSVVVNDAGAPNLDLNQPFIHLANSEQVVEHALPIAINQNAQFRRDIRQYAELHFDWDVLVDQYLEILQRWR
ncbi:MAG: glycosyltransferase family 4 protein [Armatimonadetes bacterium]|nr:glycosyltransferase family 4 protein [Armatimonadota bacterium]